MKKTELKKLVKTYRKRIDYLKKNVSGKILVEFVFDNESIPRLKKWINIVPRQGRYITFYGTEIEAEVKKLENERDASHYVSSVDYHFTEDGIEASIICMLTEGGHIPYD